MEIWCDVDSACYLHVHLHAWCAWRAYQSSGHACTCTCIDVHTCACCVSTCIYMYVCTYTYICTCTWAVPTCACTIHVLHCSICKYMYSVFTSEVEHKERRHYYLYMLESVYVHVYTVHVHVQCTCTPTSQGNAQRLLYRCMSSQVVLLLLLPKLKAQKTCHQNNHNS